MLSTGNIIKKVSPIQEIIYLIFTLILAYIIMEFVMIAPTNPQLTYLLTRNGHVFVKITAIESN